MSFIGIDDSLTAVGDLKVLQECAIPAGLRLIRDNFSLPPNNDTKHTSWIFRRYVPKIIEHTWYYLDRVVGP